MIKYTVDHKTYEAPRGISILEALLKEGFNIPHLCYDSRLKDTNRTCGLCVVHIDNKDKTVRACSTSLEDGMVIITDSPELKAFRKTRIEQLLEDHYADCVAPCQLTCPADIDIQTYLRHTANGNIAAALRTIKEKNPFPSVCGRVCPHPCEAECRRGLIDEAVNINGVKRVVADQAFKSGIKTDFNIKAESGKRIAIVGGGPAGLTAAYFTRLNGHDVTVFDKQAKMGGMMRYGIPDYRLPQNVLDEEIKAIETIGVKMRPRKALGMDITLAELQNDFDAVFLSVGSWQATSLGVEGEQLIGVWKGINFLERIAKGKKVDTGDHVVVIGGGNTAIDCARTAIRLGASCVSLIYRRTRLEMPAEETEIEAALKEGVNIQFLVSPVRFDGNQKNMIESITCIEMELGDADLSGRRRVYQKEGSEFTINATTVILAVGQKTDTSYLWNDRPVELNKWGDIKITDATMMTSEDKIFAGGDCVTGPATIIQAVNAGRQAAILMDDYVTKGYVKRSVVPYSSGRGSLEELPRYAFGTLPKLGRKNGTSIEVIDVGNPFAEADFAMTMEEARLEAERCLSCGCNERHDCQLRQEATQLEVSSTISRQPEKRFPIMNDHPLIVRDTNKCISCGKCISACKEVQGVDVLDFYFKQGKLCVGTKNGLPLEETACISCGQCVIACPCGALDYKRSTNKIIKALNEKDKKTVAFVAPAVRSVIAQHFGLSTTEAMPFIAGLLKQIGFDRVYDFSFAADLTIIEETTEFMKRLEKEKLPHFTSCCPGWINYVEKVYPDIIPYLSSCKSPQQMMGALVKDHLPDWLNDGIQKEDLFVVSIVPCLAKKGEASREEFIHDSIADVDGVLTTTELIEMAQSLGLDSSNTPLENFDEPYQRVSGAGVLFGMTGGVAEAILRMACVDDKTEDNFTVEYKAVRGMEGIKTAEVMVGEQYVRLAVVNGLRNIEPIILELIMEGRSEFDLIEVMACPGGCVSGAGHPVPESYADILQRHRILIDIDKSSQIRSSQDNPDLIELYRAFIGDVNAVKARNLFHTSYTNRYVPSTEQQKDPEQSAWKTRSIEVCIGEGCYQKGASNILCTINETIRDLELEHFYQVRPIMLTGHSPTEGVFVAIDGKKVDEDSLLDIPSWLIESCHKKEVQSSWGSSVQ